MALHYAYVKEMVGCNTCLDDTVVLKLLEDKVTRALFYEMTEYVGDGIKFYAWRLSDTPLTVLRLWKHCHDNNSLLALTDFPCRRYSLYGPQILRGNRTVLLTTMNEPETVHAEYVLNGSNANNPSPNLGWYDSIMDITS